MGNTVLFVVFIHSVQSKTGLYECTQSNSYYSRGKGKGNYEFEKGDIINVYESDLNSLRFSCNSKNYNGYILDQGEFKGYFRKIR